MSKKMPEEAVSVQEPTPSEKIPVHRVLRTLLIFLLSLACILGGILLYQLSLDDFDTKSSPAKPSSVMWKKVSLTRESPVVKKEVSPVFAMAPKVVADATPAETEQKNPPQKAPVLVSKEIPSIPAVPAVPNVEPSATPVAVEPSPVVAAGHVALGKALRLRDQLQAGQSCLDSFQIILKNRLPDESQRDKLTERLMPICTTVPAFQELETLFMKNRREALITYYRNTSRNRFMAYVKAIMTTVVDVRRLNPVKRKTKDIISLAQNALNAHDVALAVGYIQELPGEIQADFREFNGLAHSYLLAQEAVDALILSFDKKGK